MTPSKVTLKEKINRIVYFFPFQLLLMYFKKRHFTVVLWLLLFLTINSALASKYGVHLLLLYPEFMGEVGLLSHFILGISVGGLIMSFHISSYIINGYRFPFIATLSKPFYKFSINNSIIPFAFLLNYGFSLYTYQHKVELHSSLEILFHELALLAGVFLFVTLTFSYFLGTNITVLSLSNSKKKRAKQKESSGGVSQIFGKSSNWYRLIRMQEEGFRTKTYLSNFFKLEIARSSKHYDVKTLMRVLKQNKMNATIFELAVLLTVLAFGIFIKQAVVFIPSGTSFLLILTMLMIISSALHSWFRTWSTFVFILLLILVNYFSQFSEFNYLSMARGLTYENIIIPYDQASIHAHFNDWKKATEGKEAEERVLARWKQKQVAGKPKLVFINVSGGGLRSALWTYTVMSSIDTIVKGNLLNHTHLISGSSGGMIGAAYFREEGIRGLDRPIDSSLTMLSKDLLNPVAFTLAVNDIFPRWRTYTDQGRKYIYDRGYAFEEQLNANLGGVFDKRLKDYSSAEYQAETPTMLFTPTINNDGRRLLIASRPMVFLCSKHDEVQDNQQAESIDYLSFFAPASPENTKLSSVIRMSATFPYVMPSVSLPSVPEIEIADAGLRDNFGTLGSSKYILSLKEWIAENTSGVVIIQIKDSPSRIRIRENPRSTFFRGLSAPLGGFYANWLNIQQYNQEHLLSVLKSELGIPIDLIGFELEQGKDRISMSWHLTRKEKNRILSTISTSQNQLELIRLKNLLNTANSLP